MLKISEEAGKRVLVPIQWADLRDKRIALVGATILGKGEMPDRSLESPESRRVWFPLEDGRARSVVYLRILAADSLGGLVQALADFISIGAPEMAEWAMAEKEDTEPPCRGWIIVDFDARELATSMIYETEKEAQEDASELDNATVIPIEW